MAEAVRRVVLDTNVLVSAFWGGISEQIVKAWFSGQYVLLVSTPILSEYKMVFDRIFPGSEPIDRFLQAAYLKAIIVESKKILHMVKEDPSDNRFLECALEGHATYLVSGDRHLLKLKKVQELEIITPRAFLDLIAPV